MPKDHAASNLAIHVLCTASVDDRVPPFLRNSGSGWVTAEYGMLPHSTHTRTDREAARGKQSGRTQEIQRLIDALRAVTDLKALPTPDKIDCDVLQADGGTHAAIADLSSLCIWPCRSWSARRSQAYSGNRPCCGRLCGIYQGMPVLDLDYAEDSNAEADANFVLTGTAGIVEIRPQPRESLQGRTVHRNAAACPKGHQRTGEPRRQRSELIHGPHLLRKNR